MSAHTAGPWPYNPLAGGQYVVTCSDGTRIAKTAMRESHEEESANARLIAAAPEMLAKLKECEKRVAMLVGAFDVLGIDFSPEVSLAKDVAALIARIEGGQA